MKNVLILANGDMAKYFVQWVGKSRIDTNKYYITCPSDDDNCITSTVENIAFINIDPTSYMRVRSIMEDKNFATVFIVMDNKKEALFTYKNIRMICAKSLVVFVSKWDDIHFDDDNLNILNVNEIMATNLYDKLPNVPLIAKNIGLGQGEMMEILVPFGSSFAHRHIGAISHRKWKIVAIYRNEKQIFSTNGTMILPNDRLIVMGNPLVLEDVYKRVNKRKGLFPEPFGKNLYLIINMSQNSDEIEVQIEEAMYLRTQLVNTKLYIRLIQIDSLEKIKKIQNLKDEVTEVLISYKENEVFSDIDFDISQYEIGLFMLENGQFMKRNYKKHIASLRRPIYIFGEKSLYNIKKAVIVMGNEIEMESLSSSVFDFSESLNLDLNLCDYNPEGDFEESKQIVEHYESLSRLYSFKINFEKKQVNPLRELLKQDALLHIAPFVKEIKGFSLFNLFSTNFNNYFMSIKKHPQLLIPVDD